MFLDNYVNENVISSEELLSDVASSGLGSYEESHYKQKSFELHNAYIAAGTLTSAFIIVAIVVSIIEFEFYLFHCESGFHLYISNLS